MRLKITLINSEVKLVDAFGVQSDPADYGLTPTVLTSGTPAVKAENGALHVGYVEVDL